MAEGKKKVMDTLIEGGKKKLKSGLVKAGKALEDAYYYIVDKWNLSGSPLHLPGSENRPRNLTPEQRKKEQEMWKKKEAELKTKPEYYFDQFKIAYNYDRYDEALNNIKKAVELEKNPEKKKDLVMFRDVLQDEIDTLIGKSTPAETITKGMQK